MQIIKYVSGENVLYGREIPREEYAHLRLRHEDRLVEFPDGKVWIVPASCARAVNPSIERTSLTVAIAEERNSIDKQRVEGELDSLEKTITHFGV